MLKIITGKNQVKLKYVILFSMSFLAMSLSCYAQDQTKPKNVKATQEKTTEPNDYINDEANDYINEGKQAEQTTSDTIQKDPYENYNRAMFQFNETIDDYILKPIARTYNTIMPPPLNTAIHNIFDNLSEIPTVINDLLQFNFYQATSDSWRFVINSTVGIGGAIDMATKTGLTRHYEDVGLTFAKWGWTNSSYFVIPFLGPSTIRDAITLFPYYYMTIYPYIHPLGKRYLILGARFIDLRAQLLRFEKVYKEIAIDRYVFIRSAYLQRRKYLTKQNGEIDDPYTTEDTKQTASDDNSEAYYLDDV